MEGRWWVAIVLFYLLQACDKRVQGDETGQKHCTGQYFDYWSCIDKCVSSILQLQGDYLSKKITRRLIPMICIVSKINVLQCRWHQSYSNYWSNGQRILFYFQIVISASEIDRIPSASFLLSIMYEVQAFMRKLQRKKKTGMKLNMSCCLGS